MAITAVLLILLTAIHAAPAGPYRGGTNSLNLRDMDIETINENHFSSYSQIERLDLSNNGIRDIHPQGFCGLNSLFSLDLSGNEIRYLHPDIFKCTPSLERLKLKSNIELRSDVNRVFISSISITILDISFCDFTVFSDKMFSDMTNLKKVIAYNNPACQKSAMFWDDDRLECGSLRNPNLQSKNSDFRKKIGRLETSTTIRSTSTQQNKYISNVQDEGTEKSNVGSSLMKIDSTATETSKDIITSNTVLPIEVATVQTKFSEETSTEQNKYITNVQYEGTEKLAVGSSLMKIGRTSTETSRDMETNEQKTVDVIETKEQRIDGQTQLLRTETPTTKTTKRWHKYDEKELSENFLKEYKTEISQTREIRPYYFVKIRDITSLDLSDLNILSIHHLAFCGLNSLIVLNLSTNDLQYLHPHTFHCTPHLQKLNLSDNPRLGLHTHSMFIKSRSLEQLDISFCNFASLPGNMHDYLPKLKFLNAFGNSGCPQIVSQNKDIEHVPCSESGLDQEDSPRQGEKKDLETSPRNEQSYYKNFTTTQSIAMLCFSILNVGMLVIIAIVYFKYVPRTYQPINSP